MNEIINRHWCPVCEQGFETYCGLAVHMEATHLDRRIPYPERDENGRLITPLKVGKKLVMAEEKT